MQDFINQLTVRLPSPLSSFRSSSFELLRIVDLDDVTSTMSEDDVVDSLSEDSSELLLLSELEKDDDDD